MSKTESDHDNGPDWEEACRREDAVRKFVLRRDEGRKGPTVKELARELGLSRATAYRVIELFQAGGTVTSLIGKTPGRPRGHRVLDSKREALIRSDRDLLPQADEAACRALGPRNPNTLPRTPSAATELAYCQSAPHRY